MYYSAPSTKYTAVIAHIKNFTDEEKASIMKYTINYAKTAATWEFERKQNAEKTGDILNDEQTKLDLAMKQKSSEAAAQPSSIPEAPTTITHVQSPSQAEQQPTKKHRI